MKIVTYNVNGLRQRISQFGSLLKLLNSFNADIICFQETKIRRQELTSDIAIADGYESFFSCTRTCDKGRIGYSGVATFCRVKSVFSSTEVALPVAAEEGFTGIVDNGSDGKSEMPVEGLGEFPRDELLKVDSEGRCVITDHGHFVLFNVYGPRAGGDDMERIQFKLKFYQILQKRCESLFSRGRRVFVVGDLNIAPTSMDRCDAEPDFEKNEFRRWLRSMLVASGGPFFDVFRAKHPNRREAYTCWASSTGAEQFNFGSRIDHILCFGSCLHQDHSSQGHNFVICHVEECDILTEYKRWRPGNATRWKGGWNTKLEGSDHVPVYMTILEIPDIPQHDTPALSSRYLPVMHGLQQTLVSMLMKRQAATQIETCTASSDGMTTVTRCSEARSTTLKTNETSQSFINPNSKSISGDRSCKKTKKSQSSQLSLKSFFQKTSTFRNCSQSSSSDIDLSLVDVANSNNLSPDDDQGKDGGDETPNLRRVVGEDECEVAGSSQGEERKSSALQEWQRIQKLMQNSIPLCKGHKEPCVARVVKKQGPTFGRRFYVCARAEGPASNPEANCGYFKWATSKSREK